MNDFNINDIIYNIFITLINKDSPISHRISKETLKNIISEVKTIFKKESNLLHLSSDINIIGDIHGNIDDLIRIFEKQGYVPDSKYLLLGDYIDRGNNSIEVLILLFCLKLKYPDYIFMICGNHEVSLICKHYGFYEECCDKYDEEIFEDFICSFYYLPIAAIINDCIFCVHGGISSRLQSTNDINKIQRPFTGDEDFLLKDIIWSDPNKNFKTFFPNTRGCGSFFGKDAIDKFLERNNLKILIRSHEFCMYGYCCSFGDEYKKCYTVFSTSNYCGKGNVAATIFVKSNSSLTFNELPYLNEDNAVMRRIIFPDWIIVSSKLMFTPTDDDFESENEI